MNQPSARDVQNNRRDGESSNHLSSPRPGPAKLAASGTELAAAQRVCRHIARSHQENFLVASVLLPRRMRQHFFNIYAFCRTADDLADQSRSPEAALRGLEALQQQLDQTFLANPPGGIFVALADTIERFHLEKEPFDDLLGAFRQDQHQRHYATFEELLGYCRRSANPVGRIVLRLAACDTGENVQLSDQICSGLQLTNFWQDLARDHAIGRVYLPAEEMDRHGVTASMLAAGSAPPELRRLLCRHCELAESFLRAGLPLAGRVPGWLSGDVKLFAHGGLATLRAVRKNGFDVLSQRPTVSRWRQATLVGRALLGWL